MLRTLKIKNFAIIKEAFIELKEGFNVVTGETGAGKSMLVDAISILLGAKATPDDIRTGENEALLEGVFEVGKNFQGSQLLKNSGIEIEDSEITVNRRILKKGKSRIYINGSSASLPLLNEVGRFLVDICAQNENRLLMNPQYHIQILDQYGALEKIYSEYKSSFDDYDGVVKKIKDLEDKKAKSKEKEDYLKFIIKEIDALSLKPEESTLLKEKKKRLSNLEKIKDLAFGAYNRLYAGERSVLENLRELIKSTDSLGQIDPSFEKLTKDIPEIEEKLKDFSYEMKSYVDGLEFDSASLSEVDDRLSEIARIERKYGSVEEALLRSSNAKEELKEIDNFDGIMKELKKQLEEISIKLKKNAKKLSDDRKEKALLMDKKINAELKHLSMENAVFKTMVESLDKSSKKDVHILGDLTVSAQGSDSVVFYIATNVGEESRPLEYVASLGELSRIMLALKGVFYEKKSLTDTFIFDEIDTGIGGKVAEMVGRKLKDLAFKKQVLCVTHLAQIASYGDVHLFIEKKVSQGRTLFNLTELGKNQRQDELARMIGGVKITQKTHALAQELLSNSSKEM